jgi:riboflavin synthase
MFTGLIQAVGQVVNWQPQGPDHGAVLTLDVPLALWPQLPPGASLAVNGCCLTVTNPLTEQHPYPRFMLSPETLAQTTLGQLQPEQTVNLETAMTLGTPLGGHMVSGHVDATAELIQAKPYGNSHILRYRVHQADKLALIVDKGSIAVDGISLTVNTVIQDVFSVAIIPHTWQHTNLSHKPVGSLVNLETDLIGRYVYHFYTQGRIPTVYDQQAQAEASNSSIPLPGGNVRVGEWFNGAPC